MIQKHSFFRMLKSGRTLCAAGFAGVFGVAVNSFLCITYCFRTPIPFLGIYSGNATTVVTYSDLAIVSANNVSYMRCVKDIVYIKKTDIRQMSESKKFELYTEGSRFISGYGRWVDLELTLGDQIHNNPIGRVSEVSLGWPCVSFYLYDVKELSSDTLYLTAPADPPNGIRLRAPLSGTSLSENGKSITFRPYAFDGIMPTSIYWPGLFINSVVFGSLAMGCTLLFWAAIARYRRLSGRCGVCGYSLRKLEARKCPECGSNNFVACKVC